MSFGPFWLPNEFKNWKKSNDDKYKAGGKLLEFVRSGFNQWDFNRKVEKRLQEIQPEVEKLLKANIGVLLKCYFDKSIGMEGEENLFFQGVDIIGAGNNYNIVKDREGSSWMATICTPQQVRLKSCVSGSFYFWTTIFGIETVNP